MQVTTKTHTVTTKTHAAVFTADEIKAVALSYASKQAGVQATITSSDVKVGDDGSITVEIVETVTADADAAAPTSATVAGAPAAASAPAAAATSGLKFG